MNTTMADGASERLDAQIAEALFGQPGMSKLDVANRLRQLRGEGSPLLADAGNPVSPSPAGQDEGLVAMDAVVAHIDSLGPSQIHPDYVTAARTARTALASRQTVGQEPAFYLTPSDWGHIRIPMTKHRDVRALRHGFDHGDINLVPFYPAPTTQAMDLERARNEGHDGAIRYVLGYLNGVGDWGSTQYVELLNACGRERIIRSAVEDGELKFTGLGRWVAERGTAEERALIDSQAVGK